MLPMVEIKRYQFGAVSRALSIVELRDKLRGSIARDAQEFDYAEDESP